MLSWSPTMDGLPVNSIELRTNFHDDVGDQYTLSSKIETKRSVVTTPSNRKKESYKPEETPLFRKSPKHQPSQKEKKSVKKWLNIVMKTYLKTMMIER